MTEPDGRPGQWYLHVFAPEQPDLDWDNPEVRAEFEAILAFWFDRGVDGFRIDVAHGMVKEDGLPDLPPEHVESDLAAGDHPHWDRPGVHEIHRSWRRVADGYEPGRVLIGEVGVDDPDRLAQYLRRDELHAAFNFPYMATPWSAVALRGVIDDTLEAHRRVGAAPTWVMSNHDATRHVTRLGRGLHRIPATGAGRHPAGEPRAGRAPGAGGDPPHARPARERVPVPGRGAGPRRGRRPPGRRPRGPDLGTFRPHHPRPGRLPRAAPWAGEAPPFEFGPEGSHPWLPQPASWRALTAEAEARDPGSMLSLYRAALHLRREHPGLATDAFRWLPGPDGTLLFERGSGLRCAVNLSTRSIDLPPDARVVLASAQLDGDTLPPDGAAWFERPS